MERKWELGKEHARKTQNETNNMYKWSPLCWKTTRKKKNTRIEKTIQTRVWRFTEANDTLKMQSKNEKIKQESKRASKYFLFVPLVFNSILN